MPILLLALVGVAGIITGGFALRFVASAIRDQVAGRRLGALRRVALVVGLALGIASWPLTFAMGYSYATTREVGRVVGLPFMAAYFDAAGRDYVGPLTLLAVLANCVFWASCPQIMLAGYVIARKRLQSHPRNDA